MAIYHLHVKVISRKAGSSAVASAAYRSASRLRDERIDCVQDFSAKRGVVHSEILLPDGAREHLGDRERLWNDVEAGEVRKDAQLAREVEFAIPREMTQAQGIALARDFVQSEFIDQGMIADLNVHWDIGEDGMPNPMPMSCSPCAAWTRTGSERSSGTGTARRWWNAGASVGPSMSTRGFANSTSTPASIIAALRRRASTWSRKHRSVHRRSASREKASRPQTAPRCTVRSRATTATGSSPILRWRLMRSHISNRPSRAGTWRSSRIGTAMASTSSTRSWARCAMRPTWSNLVRIRAELTASPRER